jgi:hypothetical protein
LRITERKQYGWKEKLNNVTLNLDQNQLTVDEIRNREISGYAVEVLTTRVLLPVSGKELFRQGHLHLQSVQILSAFLK